MTSNEQNAIHLQHYNSMDFEIIGHVDSDAERMFTTEFVAEQWPLVMPSKESPDE